MNAIVIVDRLWAIGREGGLLFDLPQEIKRFRSLTMGGTVILGRRTLDSFPGGRPLVGRRNIVISRNVDFDRSGLEVASAPMDVLDLVKDEDPDEVWLIGGGSVYAALLSRCKRAYVTKVDARVEEADTFFPNLDKLPGWTVEREEGPLQENGLTYRFVDYINERL